MAVVSAPQGFTHELPHARFASLATPSRGSTETALWRVELLPNTPAQPHSLTREELFYVLAGSAQVVMDGSTQVARTGDVIVIPKDTEFAISSATDQSVELLCCFPVGGQARLQGALLTPPWAE